MGREGELHQCDSVPKTLWCIGNGKLKKLPLGIYAHDQLCTLVEIEDGTLVGEEDKGVMVMLYKKIKISGDGVHGSSFSVYFY